VTNLSPEERQKLREKHAKCSCGHCTSNECSAGCVGDYPCDALRVLDVLEKTEKKLTHYRRQRTLLRDLVTEMLEKQ